MSVEIAGADRLWWKSQYWLKAPETYPLSLWSVCSSDLYRHESGRCYSLSFILIYILSFYLYFYINRNISYWIKESCVCANKLIINSLPNTPILNYNHTLNFLNLRHILLSTHTAKSKFKHTKIILYSSINKLSTSNLHRSWI